MILPDTAFMRPVALMGGTQQHMYLFNTNILLIYKNTLNLYSETGLFTGLKTHTQPSKKRITFLVMLSFPLSVKSTAFDGFSSLWPRMCELVSLNVYHWKAHLRTIQNNHSNAHNDQKEEVAIKLSIVC